MCPRGRDRGTVPTPTSAQAAGPSGSEQGPWDGCGWQMRWVLVFLSPEHPEVWLGLQLSP